MKTFVLIFAIVAAVAAIDVYPTKYDSLDIDSILGNKRLFDNYVLCLLKQGKCTEEGGVLRDVIPDALITGCSKCNEHQKVTVRKVIRFLIKERNSDWLALLKEYDPESKHQTHYQQYLKDL